MSWNEQLSVSQGIDLCVVDMWRQDVDNQAETCAAQGKLKPFGLSAGT